MAVREDGSILAWGLFGGRHVPSPNSGFVRVAMGERHTLGLKEDGSIVAWGDNSEGQCDVPLPNSGFVAVAVSRSHSMGLKDDGSVVAWGNNVCGQSDLPVPNSGFVAIAAGPGYSLGLRREPDCFPSACSGHSDWIALGRPECWCNPRQCHGDVDGLVGGSAKAGYYRVGPADLNVLISAWMVKEPPLGPGIASIPNGICADFAHDRGGSTKAGLYRVGPSDLNILIANWLITEPPHGTGVEPDCLNCP
jgi:hypothetical protein